MVNTTLRTWGALSAIGSLRTVTLYYDYRTTEVAGNSRRQLLENSEEFSDEKSTSHPRSKPIHRRFFLIFILCKGSRYNMSEEVPSKLTRSYATTLIDMAEDSDAPIISRGPAGKAPVSSAVDMYDLCGDEEIIENDNNYKREFQEAMQCDEDYVDLSAPEQYDEPDLESYFAPFNHLDDTQVIAICRTYANYLAQKVRARLPAHLKNVKRVKVAKK